MLYDYFCIILLNIVQFHYTLYYFIILNIIFLKHINFNTNRTIHVVLISGNLRSPKLWTCKEILNGKRKKIFRGIKLYISIVRWL